MLAEEKVGVITHISEPQIAQELSHSWKAAFR